MRHIRFLYKKSKKGFAVIKAAGVAGVPDEEAGCLPEAFKADLESPLRGSVPVRV